MSLHIIHFPAGFLPAWPFCSSHPYPPLSKINFKFSSSSCLPPLPLQPNCPRLSVSWHTHTGIATPTFLARIFSSPSPRSLLSLRRFPRRCHTVREIYGRGARLLRPLHFIFAHFASFSFPLFIYLPSCPCVNRFTSTHPPRGQVLHLTFNTFIVSGFKALNSSSFCPQPTLFQQRNYLHTHTKKIQSHVLFTHTRTRTIMSKE